MTNATHRHPPGVIRREFLQVGFSAFLGLGGPRIFGATPTDASLAPRKPPTGFGGVPRVKSVILVFLTGGLSHLDSFDMKPDSPDGIRSDFRPISTRVPGIRIAEHLPRLAAQADKLAIVRSMAHRYNNHLNATHELLTGHPQPGAFFDKIASRGDYPCYAAALDYLAPSPSGIPRGVMLPTFLMEGPLVWPGQHAGFLGPEHDPWQIRDDPSKPDFRVESMSMPEGFSVERLSDCTGLLNELSARRDSLSRRAEAVKDPFSDHRDRALSLLLSGRVARAFELGREDPRTRDRYGRHMFGQSLLLARRLVEAEVPIVQINMGRVQTWDHHMGIFPTLKERLLPPTDRGVAALLEDLDARGLLDETLVIMTGEFGRTPRLSRLPGRTAGAVGRDHWSRVFSTVFAGGGVRGGQTIGQSDKLGAHPASPPFSPGDLSATVYAGLGIDPESELRDQFNRPLQLSAGRPISALYSG
jgi:hypothetical protein